MTQLLQDFFAALGSFILVILALVVFMIICRWRIFTKAGKPGWAAIIPIYNIIVTLEIINKPIWWIFMLLIPFVNIYFAIMMVHHLSLAFGQGAGFTVLLIFLPIVGYPMLAFGSAQYTRPADETPRPI